MWDYMINHAGFVEGWGKRLNGRAVGWTMGAYTVNGVRCWWFEEEGRVACCFLEGMGIVLEEWI